MLYHLSHNAAGILNEKAVTEAGEDYGLYPLYSTSTQGGAGNRGFYSNPEVDRMLEAARTSTDQDERRGLYAEIQNILQDEVPIVNLYWQLHNVGLQNSVENFELAPTGVHRLRDVRFEG